MEELSIEERATRYDEAINRMKHYVVDKYGCSRIKVADVFPELAESEDERIRKEILEYFQQFDNKELRGVDISDWIAWLENTQYAIDHAKREGFQLGYKAGIEKQGEQKPTEEYNITGIGSKHAQGKLGEMIKKLKPISKVLEQKPAEWSEEDELNIRELERLVKQVWATAEHENDKDTIHKMSDLSFFLKTLKPQLKQEWSKDDEAIWAEISDLLWEGYKQSGSKFTWDDIRNWLNPKIKSLKDRVHPKQEWSEEDKLTRDALINLVEMYYGSCIDKSEKNRLLDWLKSLSPQNRWKPSEEQIRELGIVATGKGWFSKEILSELLEQMKKLREE